MNRVSQFPYEFHHGHYIGRFAPSPTGALHLGSLVAALASWLDARAHDGQWLVRMEDIDTPRCVQGADHFILQQLSQCGFKSDVPVLYQSKQVSHYCTYFKQLKKEGLIYPCTCSRKTIFQNQQYCTHNDKNSSLVYIHACRNNITASAPCAWRLNIDKAIAYILNNKNNTIPYHQKMATPPLSRTDENSFCQWQDRRKGPQTQNIAREVGDFVLFRADGLWAYQLAVVLDDAYQNINHIVRGEDLLDNTARQILLQTIFNLPPIHYLHTPLALGLDGKKLSKQNGAEPIDTQHPIEALCAAAHILKLPMPPYNRASASVTDFLNHWVNYCKNMPLWYI